MPDVRDKSDTLPVGCDLHRLKAARPEDEGASTRTAPPLILWNQRWEYDKNPQAFFRALDAVAERGVPFRLALAGANVRQQAAEFEAARARLGNRVVHFGHADRATYHRLLWQADIVASTAIHEFFGIAMVEAIFCGCFPILPQRLAYPELLPAALGEEVRDRVFYRNVDGLVSHLTWALMEIEAARAMTPALQRAVARFDWTEMAPRYDAVMEAVAERSA
jgi:glycosyltransferase involved in cell wall biosynthesis